MRIGSLFAGMGGFDLAAESLGWSTAWVSEIDPFGSSVLAKHFPHAPNLGDVTRIDWSLAERVDVLCAGFPCQPHSLAGKRKASEDERDLWSECVRAVGLLRPRYFVGENVSGLLTSEGGRFFNRVVSDLAALGYAVEWGILSAAECGAPHQRSRVFIVGYAELSESCALGQFGGDGTTATNRHGQASQMVRRFALPDWSDAIPFRGADGTVRLIPRGAVADRHGDVGHANGRVANAGTDGRHDDQGSRGVVHQEAGSRPEPSLRAVADGIPDRLAGRNHGNEAHKDVIEAAVEVTHHGKPGTLYPRVVVEDGSLWPVTESEPGRVAKLRAIGNAVVPAWVVAGPFRRIIEIEKERGGPQGPFCNVALHQQVGGLDSGPAAGDTV